MSDGYITVAKQCLCNKLEDTQGKDNLRVDLKPCNPLQNLEECLHCRALA